LTTLLAEESMGIELLLHHVGVLIY